MFWVILVYFNLRNTLPKFGTFLLGHPVYRVHTTNKFICSNRNIMIALFFVHNLTLINSAELEHTENFHSLTDFPGKSIKGYLVGVYPH